MRIVVAALLGGAGMALAGAAGAQTPGQLPERLVSCAAKVNDAERLACYDAAVGSMSSEARQASEARVAEAKVAQAAAAAAAASAAQAEAAKAEADRLAGFGKPASAGDTVSEIEAAITEMLRDSTGKSVFILDNGQIWRQADGFRFPAMKVGTAVTVKRGALGSFRLVPADSNRSVQVIRMR